MKEDKHITCEHGDKRWKQRNGLKYHKAHSVTCCPELLLPGQQDENNFQDINAAVDNESFYLGTS